MLVSRYFTKGTANYRKELTEVIFSRVSDIPLNNSSRNTVTVAILGNLVDRKESGMVALRTNRDGDLWVIVRLQDFACLSHIIQFFFDDMLVLALANTIAEIEDTQRNFSSICLKRAEECTHELNHILGYDDFFTITVGIGDCSKTGTLYYRIKDILAKI